MICDLSALSLVGMGLLVAGQFVARKPVIQLRILLDRSFAGVFIVSLATGAALYGILYIIPQFLVAVAGYNAEQSGYVTAISGVPTLVMLALFPLLVRVVDIRAAIAFGLLLYGVSCLMDAHLSPDTAGAQFFWSQVIRGFAQFFALLFLNQAATDSVSRQYAEDASGLFNAARNLGGSFGLAAIATLLDQRTSFHVARLGESITANSLAGQAIVRQHGLAPLAMAIQGQAMVMAYADLYWVFGVALVVMIPLVLLLRPIPRRARAWGAA